MSEEVVAALVGAGVGGGTAAAVAWLLHVLQCRDAEKDWRRDNQRDRDWKVEDLIIDVHDFYRDPMIVKQLPITPMGGQSIGAHIPVYDQDRPAYCTLGPRLTKIG